MRYHGNVLHTYTLIVSLCQLFVRPDWWLTSISYNSAVFYIGANNMYNFSLLPTASIEYEGLSRQTDTATNDDRNVTLDNSRIDSAYYGNPSFHEYGDLYLAIDGYFYANVSTFPELGADGWPSSGPDI